MTKKIKLIMLLCLAVMIIERVAYGRNQNDTPSESELDAKTRQVLKKAQKLEGMSDEDWDRALLMYKIQMSQNNDFDFYGAIIDQNGKAVEGVEILAEISSYDPEYILNGAGWGSEQKKEQWTGFSDKKGFFRVKGRGTRLEIKGLKMDGYVSPPVNRGYSVGRQAEGAVKRPIIFKKPEMFKIWTQELVAEQNSIVSVDHSIFCLADGLTNKMDLISGSLTNSDTNADLVFSIKSDARPNMPGGTRYDWTFRLSSTSGGVIETERNDLYFAPADGYKDMIVEEKANPTNWRSGFDTMIFIKSYNGQAYGFLFLGVGASFDGKALLSVRGYVNTNGSPNLLRLEGFVP